MALEILGLTETASKDDIIKKYQDLMKKTIQIKVDQSG